jgi:alanyl-tRNA synthetase
LADTNLERLSTLKTVQFELLTSRQIRSGFISFFQNRGHTFIPSAPVVPLGDPTLLFTNAGMNQFKDIFLGQKKSSFLRAVNSQKCIRVSGKHNDLEEVGLSNRHHTFFEMLGNWSFEDYYKKEAIRWAWELITQIWNIPKNRLYATVHLDDEEAEKCWKSETDIDPQRILRQGEKDNFWKLGKSVPVAPAVRFIMIWDHRGAIKMI